MNGVQFKEQVALAFKKLRVDGYVARQNFMCCGSCAGYALATFVEKQIGQGKPRPKGVVFFTRQDAEDLVSDGAVYVAFGQIDSEQYGPVGDETEAVGRAAKAVFEQHGLVVDWDGSSATRLLVKAADRRTGAVRDLYEEDPDQRHDLPAPAPLPRDPEEVEVDKCAKGMKLVAVQFIMQVGAGAPVEMVTESIKTMIAEKGMSQRTQDSVRAWEVAG